MGFLNTLSCTALSALFCAFCIFSLIETTQAQYEDVRCKCICPSTAVVTGNSTNRKLYKGNVTPSKCSTTSMTGTVVRFVGKFFRILETPAKLKSRGYGTHKIVPLVSWFYTEFDSNCEGVVIPQVGDSVLRMKQKEFCPRCECRYERRNTTTIFVVVIIIIWVISLLVVYMLFLMCLDPLLNKRRSAYHEHTNEEVTLQDEPMTTLSRPRTGSTNVLNRVGQQQDKWKKQVQEQRRNIYDRHTMLN